MSRRNTILLVLFVIFLAIDIRLFTIQIKDKQYYKQYELSKKKIFLNGVTFDTRTGQIADWQTEEIEAGN